MTLSEKKTCESCDLVPNLSTVSLSMGRIMRAGSGCRKQKQCLRSGWGLDLSLRDLIRPFVIIQDSNFVTKPHSKWRYQSQRPRENTHFYCIVDIYIYCTWGTYLWMTIGQKSVPETVGDWTTPKKKVIGSPPLLGDNFRDFDFSIQKLTKYQYLHVSSV